MSGNLRCGYFSIIDSTTGTDSVTDIESAAGIESVAEPSRFILLC